MITKKCYSLVAESLIWRICEDEMNEDYLYSIRVVFPETISTPNLVSPEFSLFNFI